MNIVQDWAGELGLRHQGVLVAAVRGSDTEAKEGASKWINRFYRSCLLHAHCGDPRGALSYMTWTDDRAVFETYAEAWFDAMDNQPVHYVMHMLYGAEVMGYKHPATIREWWLWFYRRAVKKLHLQPETEAQMDERLNRSEKEFAETAR